MLEGVASDMECWRHHLHQHPEPAFAETATAAFVAAQLRALGVDVTQGVGGTGVVGRLSNGTGERAIAPRMAQMGWRLTTGISPPRSIHGPRLSLRRASSNGDSVPRRSCPVPRL